MLNTYSTGADMFKSGEQEQGDEMHIKNPAQTALVFEPVGRLRTDLLSIRRFLVYFRDRIAG